MVSNADYLQKFPTAIAGNELPDMLQTPNGSPPPIPNLPQLLDKRFTNLSEFLSGDAVKEYPNAGQPPHPDVEVRRLQRGHLRHPDPARSDRQLPLHPAGPVRGGGRLAHPEEL